MSFESDLFALLGANAGVSALITAGATARAYPVLAPAGVALPYLTWQRIASEAAELAGRASGERISVQVDCWAKTYDDAAALADAVRAAIQPGTGVIRGALESDLDDYEDASGLYRRMQTYVLYHPAN
jgi:hypothetical protein